MFDFVNGPYSDMYRTKVIKKGSKRNVLHRQTCPKCGKKLVNLYYSEQHKEYFCKDCVKESDEGGETT